MNLPRATILLFASALLPSGLGAQTADRAQATATTIEHLIVVVGENISSHKLFATYETPPGQPMPHMLSPGIRDQDGHTDTQFGTAPPTAPTGNAPTK